MTGGFSVSLSRFPLCSCCGHIALQGEPSPYQCVGGESHCSGSGNLSSPVVGPECRPDEQQCHCCRFSLESGRHSLSHVVSHDCRGSSLDRAPLGLCQPGIFQRSRMFWRTSSVVLTRCFPWNGPSCHTYSRGSAGSSAVLI